MEEMLASFGWLSYCLSLRLFFCGGLSNRIYGLAKTKATTQLDIRLAFFLIFALVTVAERVGAENILGAFLAGMVMKLLEPSEATKDKLTSIGYGFFIPIFFIMTGVGLNLKSLFAHPSSLMLLPVLVIFLFLAKAPVVFLYMRYFEKKNAFAGGFLTLLQLRLFCQLYKLLENCMQLLQHNQMPLS